MLTRNSDRAPVEIANPHGRSPFLLIGDHAGNRVPAALNELGLAPADLARHIGWDIGAAALGAALAERLDATFVAQVYSRLVIDCNRAPGAIDAIPATSDATPVPGNAGLSPADRAERVAAIHTPYHEAIAAEIARRDADGRETVLVALHSFTPALANGAPRPWQIGVLHDAGDPRFALAFLASLCRDPGLTVGDNEPYRMDSIDYTIPRHAYPARRRYVEIEVRQDLLSDGTGVEEWCARIEAALTEAHAAVPTD